MKPIPVILDTDIGDDIDDTWALALMLRCPELDVKLITTDFGNPRYRGALVARLLQAAGRTDIPVGLGPDSPGPRAPRGPQAAWLEGFDLFQYQGTVHDDGVRAVVETIRGSSEPVTLICIGPLPTIHAALAREPGIGSRARFVGMCGSIRRNHKNDRGAVPEYNIAADVPSAQAVFSAPWDMTITPLDTCGFVRLAGAHYQRIKDCGDPLIRAVLENYRLWEKARDRPPESVSASSVLFDTVAVYLAFAEDWLSLENLPVRVSDDGYTRVEPGARTVRCATEWKNQDAFEEFLVDRLVGTGV